MKKYIVPAVEITAMHNDTPVMLLGSFGVGSLDGGSTKPIVGGSTDESDGGVGQLTRGLGWNCEDWTGNGEEVDE